MNQALRVLVLTTMMASVCPCLAPVLAASDAVLQQEQLQKSKQAEQEREARLTAPRVTIDSTTTKQTKDGLSSGDAEPVPVAMSPSFNISNIVVQVSSDGMTRNGAIYDDIENRVPTLIQGPLAMSEKEASQTSQVPREFEFLVHKAQDHSGTSMTMADINALVKELNQELINRGYVTSRIVIPTQNVRSGHLRLLLTIGYVVHIKHSEESTGGTWRNAFSLRDGDVLNIRKLEQGLEQMKRVSSQDVTMSLAARETPFTSDVLLTVTRKKPIHTILSLDDSGLKDTGRLQWVTTIGIDNPFQANDLLQVSINGDGDQSSTDKGTRGRSFYYSIPDGNDTYTLSYFFYKYHQTVASQPFLFFFSSRTHNLRFNWNHVFERTQNVKRSWDISVAKRSAHNYINDMEIDVQALETTTLEFGLSERRYIGNKTLYSRLGFRNGVGWLGAQDDYGGESPTTHYTMLLLDVDYVVPRTWGHRPASITTSFHGQWLPSGDRLYSRDMISIGNRYTVTGFDGEYTLMGESGWYLRNEISTRITQLHSDVYLSVDMGAVYGPSTDILVGRFIAGTALGIRGQFNSGLFYDAFIGRPIYRPEGYHTKRITGGFSAGWRF